MSFCRACKEWATSWSDLTEYILKTNYFMFNKNLMMCRLKEQAWDSSLPRSKAAESLTPVQFLLSNCKCNRWTMKEGSYESHLSVRGTERRGASEAQLSAISSILRRQFRFVTLTWRIRFSFDEKCCDWSSCFVSDWTGEAGNQSTVVKRCLDLVLW